MTWLEKGTTFTCIVCILTKSTGIEVMIDSESMPRCRSSTCVAWKRCIPALNEAFTRYSWYCLLTYCLPTFPFIPLSKTWEWLTGCSWSLTHQASLESWSLLWPKRTKTWSCSQLDEASSQQESPKHTVESRQILEGSWESQNNSHTWNHGNLDVNTWERFSLLCEFVSSEMTPAKCRNLVCLLISGMLAGSGKDSGFHQTSTFQKARSNQRW